MILLEQMKKHALETPEKPAFIDMAGRRTTTYAQMWELTGKAAAKLKALGIQKGEAVLVCMGRRMEFIAAEIGVFKAGGMAVPVLPEYPAERINYIRENSGAKLVITEDFFENIEQYEAAEPVETSADDRLWAIYTSGSTGKPKGVVFTLDVLDTYLAYNLKAKHEVQDITFAALASLSFVVTVDEYFNTLSLGGCVCMADDETRKDITKLSQFHAECKASVAFVPPRMLGIYRSIDPALRVILTGSERLSSVAPPEGCKVINNYGQTETCGTVCSFIADAPYDTVPIGKPKSNIAIHLFDDNGAEVPDGETGEICIDGHFPHEYIGMPEQSARTFEKLENGLIRVHTGDLGYKLPDGNYVYVNRKDWMVKINGQRVDPSEVEAAIKGFDGIKGAAARDFTSPSGQVYLCGYYVGDVDEAALQDALGKRLAPYMMPAFLIKLDSIPTNINGKLDRSKLLPPDIKANKAAYSAPQNELQQKLCRTYTELLSCGRVGIDDSFFDLGGDSIKAMQLQNVMGLPALTAELIFRCKTPRNIVAELQNSAAHEDILGQAMAEKREEWPLTPAQMGVYLACVKDPQGLQYNIPVHLEFDKTVFDLDRLRLAVKTALEHHGAMHVTLNVSSNGPVMVYSELSADIPVKSIAKDGLAKELKAFVRPFEMSGGLLWRAAIYDAGDVYVLCLDIHHIVFDGTSLSVLLREIALSYEGHALAPETVPQFALGAYEEKLAASQAAKESKEYFDAKLSLIEDPASPAEDFAGDPAQEPKPSDIAVLLPGEELSAADIEAFCAAKGITVNALFLGAYQYALAKISGQEQVFVCAASHGRHDPRLQNTVGMLEHTLPLVNLIDKAAEQHSVEAFLSECENCQHEAMAHDAYPLVSLAAEYGLNLDFIFAYQADAFSAMELCGRRIPVQEIPTGCAKFKLSLVVDKFEGNYRVKLEYRSDIYRRSSAEALLDMYAAILRGFMSSERLCDVQLCSQKQLELLDSFNETDTVYDRSKTVINLFRAQAAEHPCDTAVVYQEKTFTYRELDEMTDRLACRIVSIGIGREDVVSVLIPRCEYMAIASLGVLKAGAGYQPLDPSYPEQRLSFMVKDANAKLLIADESLRSLLPDFGGPVIFTKDIPALPGAGVLPAAPKPNDLFIMLYSSGTTGTPKGVMLEHSNIACFCDWYRKCYELSCQSRVAAYASYGFDANMMDMYPTLTAGATLYIVPEEVRLDLDALGRFYEQNGITQAFMTTQMGRMFAANVENTTLRCLSVGGETLVPVQPCSDYSISNIYGPTECTVCITAYQNAEREQERVPIGKALDNVKLYIADAFGRRLPIAAVGELCAAGAHVGRGYLNRPELTAFCENPYTSDPDYRRMYRTGDMVRMRSDGNIDFIGRRDGQIKVRGFRIELSEVERVICEFEGVKQAAAVAFDAPAGGKAIAAYVVSTGKLDVSELKRFIADKKPAYMVPAAIMQLDALPVNVNGKVDRRKLPKPVNAAVEDAEEPQRPMSMLEKELHDIAAKIIGNENFGVTADLMQQGLTSLSGIKLAVELKKKLGYEADAKKIMAGCSILSLENDIQQYLLDAVTAGSKERPSAQKARRQAYPLSAAQFGVFADCMRSPLSTAYNIPMELKFPPETDTQLLAQAVREVMLAHPYVFTRLSLSQNDVEQAYVAGAEFTLPVKEMTEAEYSKYVSNYVNIYNLTRDRLFRLTCVKTEQAVYLLCDFHHIIFDGASVEIFLSQLKAALEGEHIQPEEYTYFDYIDEQAALAGSEKYSEAEAFFAAMLKDCDSPSELASDVREKRDGSLAEVCEEIDFGEAEAFCSANSVTPAQLYLAAVLYTVARFTGGTGAYINTISNGRSDLKLTNCFGMFVKTLAVGCELEDVSALDFVRKAGKMFRDAIEYELYPYDTLCKKFGYAPNIMYEYQLGVVSELRVHGVEVVSRPIGSGEPKFKQAVHVAMRAGRPCIVVQYDTACYSEQFMRTFAASVAAAAQGLVREPEKPVRKLSLLSAAQKAQLERFAYSRLTQPQYGLMHTAFERQAIAAHEKAAVVTADGTLSYGEMESKANAAANALLKRGLGGKRCVLLLSRTPKVLLAMLGVLKAGGAYIPTSISYPKERIDAIISDSGAACVITEGSMAASYENAVLIDDLLNEEDTARPEVNISPDSLCYLIYTSGSTGKPKGVMIRHRGVANYLTNDPANIQVNVPVTCGSCYGSVTTLAFDMAVKEIWVALSHGMTLAFANEEQTMDPTALGRFFLQNKVDVFNATPSRLLQYMEVDEFAEAMAQCKVILCGGEAYPEALLSLLRSKTKARILNTYGPTEITVSSNAADLTNASEVSIGRPLLNYREAIVDRDDNLLPAGVVGELLISGAGVGAGYCNLPEQTAKAFTVYHGQPTYRSGDFARWTADGNVVVLGRKDDQIKLRGLRIELGEITRCLMDIDGITRAVAAIRHLGQEDVLCAWYTASKPMDQEAIKAELAKRLTSYMIPAAFVHMKAMPVTPNGKINIKALPAPVIEARKAGREAKTANEKLLCGIYADILKLEHVYADDSFFELGGSSLTVTRVVIAAAKAGFNIAYGDVFAYPTPQRLAAYLSGSKKDNDFADLGSFDYSAIDALLAHNTLENFCRGELRPFGTVLVTGAAGFLGMHIVKNLLHDYSGKVYCLLRGKGKFSAKKRLDDIFYYYFEEDLNEKYGGRIAVAEGDITDPQSLEALKSLNIDTIFNCAAVVKHFSAGTEIEDVNYGGVLNLIKFCEGAHCRLIHVSTMSVGGVYIGQKGSADRLEETQLYIGQRETSKYTLSKFLAERAILSAAANGLDAKIMRVGTLAPRAIDGEYQINFATNNFMRRLKSVWLIGCYPYESIEMQFELSPIDQTAQAILLLAQTPKANIVLHPFNDHTLMMGDLYNQMDEIGLEVHGVEASEYLQKMEEAKASPDKAAVLSGFIAYENSAHGEKVYAVGKCNKMTMQVLYRMGFRWSATSEEYMRRFLNGLRGLGFFD